jgi:hypothetical protein
VISGVVLATALAGTPPGSPRLLDSGSRSPAAERIGDLPRRRGREYPDVGSWHIAKQRQGRHLAGQP